MASLAQACRYESGVCKKVTCIQGHLITRHVTLSNFNGRIGVFDIAGNVLS